MTTRMMTRKTVVGMMAFMTVCTTGWAQDAELTPGGDWMGRLADDVLVARVSIPGAHDSATGCGWGPDAEETGNSYARTQDLSIAQQWHTGVRAFDLRPCLYEGYMNLNHGIVPTSMHFEEALELLRDSLAAHPTEFAVIHLLHETDGDQVEDDYGTRLKAVLAREDLKPLFVKFKTGLTVGDMRGKILLLSRDNYATSITVGGVFKNWTGEANWDRQTQGRINGPGGTAGTCYMQDYSDTHNTGGINIKINAIKRLLDFSTTYTTTNLASIRWIFNFASAYSKVLSIFGYEISTSEGYRDNAAHTHAAILDYLDTHQAGPMGVVIMDYVGVDQSQGYEVKGAQLVKAIIDNNFKYLDDVTKISSPKVQGTDVHAYNLNGIPTTTRGLYIYNGKKTLVK